MASIYFSILRSFKVLLDNVYELLGCVCARLDTIEVANQTVQSTRGEWKNEGLGMVWIGTSGRKWGTLNVLRETLALNISGVSYFCYKRYCTLTDFAEEVVR